MRRLVVLAALALAVPACAAQPGTSVPVSEGPSARPVTLDFFHCAVVPFRLDAELWVVRDGLFDEASLPPGITGSGTVVRDGDALQYTDVEGGELVFDRWTQPDGPYCD